LFFAPIAQRTRAPVFGFQVECPQPSLCEQNRTNVLDGKIPFCS